MSYRYNNAFVKPGLNTLVSPTPIYTPNGLWSWGNNANGVLGLNNVNQYSSPKQIGSLTNWNQIGGGGYYHMLSIKSDGTLWAWGRNGSGELGLGNTTDYSSPKQVGSLTNWKQCFGAYFSSFAIKTDGTLWAWGGNTSGFLGLGNTTYFSSPKQVGLLTNWLQISAAYNNVAAIKTDGTLWSWGRNNSGQLGLGNTTYYSSPKQIGALTNWSYVSCGNGEQVIAIKTDGTLWSWGSNINGQLGLGNTTYYSSPKQVGSLTTWSSISALGGHCLSIKTDGTLWAWGYNGNGQLGIGSIVNKSSPTQVGLLTNWSKIAVSPFGRFSLVCKIDGTLWAWGKNQSGQLGLGNTTYYSSPKQVGLLTNWLSIACAYRSSFGIQY